MRGPIFSALTFILLMFEAAPAGAADIWMSDHPAQNLILEGTIASGDYDKLGKLIDEYCPGRWTPRCPDRILLASPGGSLLEAMKIGRLIRKLRLDTEVPEEMPPDIRQTITTALKFKDPQRDYMCASSCFFIYVAGIYRSSLRGVLGIHRPYLSDADQKTLSADQAMESSTQIRTIVETYLREMGVPSKYADRMFSISGDQMYWIDRADFEADFWGFIPELKDWVNAKCDKRTDVEKRLWDIQDEKLARGESFTPEDKSLRQMLGKKLESQIYCEGDARDDMREKAWRAYRGY
jgi:hypothetical protein